MKKNVCKCIRVYYIVRTMRFTTFFGPITPYSYYISSTLSLAPSLLRHRKGITMDQGIAIFYEYWPQPLGPLSHHLYLQKLTTIISRYDKNFLHFQDISVVNRYFDNLTCTLQLSNIYFGLLSSKSRQHLRFNLLFGLIHHLYESSNNGYDMIFFRNYQYVL